MNLPYLNESGYTNFYLVPEAKTGFTLSAANQGQILLLNPNSALLITIPIGLPKGFYCAFIKIGDAADVTLSPASGVVLGTATEETGSSVITSEFVMVELLMSSNNSFVGTNFGVAGTDLTAALAATSLLRSYLATGVSFNNTVTFANTALSVPVVAGIYSIELILHVEVAVQGLKFDFNSPATDNFVGEWTSIDATDPAATPVSQRVAVPGTDFSGTSAVTSFTTFKGSAEFSAAGNFILRSAQVSADASDSTILRGSTLILTKTT